MRLPRPKSDRLIGIYGGFGRRDADKAVRPTVTPPTGPDTPLPKHRRLRLRKLRARTLMKRVRPTTPFAVVIACLVAAGACVLLSHFVFRLLEG